MLIYLHEPCLIIRQIYRSRLVEIGNDSQYEKIYRLWSGNHGRTWIKRNALPILANRIFDEHGRVTKEYFGNNAAGNYQYGDWRSTSGEFSKMIGVFYYLVNCYLNTAITSCFELLTVEKNPAIITY